MATQRKIKDHHISMAVDGLQSALSYLPDNIWTDDRADVRAARRAIDAAIAAVCDIEPDKSDD